MFVDGSSPLTLKRRRLSIIDPMEAVSVQAKAAATREKFGRELRVFETPSASQTPIQASIAEEESDEFYELTPEDYYRLLATKKDDKFLKTRKLREAEEAARRSKLTKAVIRVRFPDNITLEVKFHPAETIQCLIDLLKRVVAHPDIPFYLYTTPPKKQIKDFLQDFYSAGFIPGAIVYFAYDLSRDNSAAAAAGSSPYLHEEILSIKDVEVVEPEPEGPAQPPHEPATDVSSPAPVVQEPKPADKKPTKPKWFKM
ncbi:PREDICTED: plant UBX domain-containing protein 1 [Tarenaya hassleriana]|uniref:plant UBX domain-containing protein 1 n=1 Tax=Tarenaya hassleriana TaxID=28532 RepID=UPI00053C2B64|nr:PREDICTED: plant UBX domain-containing protein 1 [Tarenaya hassleriana]